MQYVTCLKSVLCVKYTVSGLTFLTERNRQRSSYDVAMRQAPDGTRACEGKTLKWGAAGLLPFAHGSKAKVQYLRTKNNKYETKR